MAGQEWFYLSHKLDWVLSNPRLPFCITQRRRVASLGIVSEMLEQAIYIAENEERYSERWKRGASGDVRFLQINPAWGVKMFRYRDDMLYSYEMQQRASGELLAPPVGQMLEARLDFEKIVWYGYLTGVADMDTPKNHNHRMQLRRDLQGIGIDNPDLNFGNFGWYEGRIVCIDFDASSYT